MNLDRIEKATADTYRFVDRVHDLKIACKGTDKAEQLWRYPKQTGAVRRASLDLTRALADMRRGNDDQE